MVGCCVGVLLFTFSVLSSQLSSVSPCVEALLCWVQSSPATLAALLVATPRTAAAACLAELEVSAAALQCDVPLGASGGGPQPLPIDCHR